MVYVQLDWYIKCFFVLSFKNYIYIKYTGLFKII